MPAKKETTMAVSVSVSSEVTSQKKALWAWVVSEKNNKFGSTQTESTVVGELVGVYSALIAIPEHLDVIIRSRQRAVTNIINDPSKVTKNPVVLKIFQVMKSRSGKVSAVTTSDKNLTENDRKSFKMTLVLARKYKQKAGAGSLLSPSKSNKVKVSVSSKSAVKPAVTKRKQKNEVLVTGLEDYDDAPLSVIKKEPATGKPVLCSSCGGPISPLTNECFCSA